jgi:hypothetical protein
METAIAPVIARRDCSCFGVASLLTHFFRGMTWLYKKSTDTPAGTPTSTHQCMTLEEDKITQCYSFEHMKSQSLK